MIWALLYIAGYVVSYLLGRKLGKIISFQNAWTRGDRIFWLWISLFSWVGAICAGMYLLIFYKNDEPASW